VDIFTGGSGDTTLGLAETFVVLFVTLGPLNCLRTFAQVTKRFDVPTQRRIAVRAYAIATISTILSAFVGSFLLGKWKISVGALALAAAIILFLVALRSIIALYGEQGDDSSAPPPVPTPTSIAFPYIATPYGIAVVIVLLTLGPAYWLQILGLVIVVMLIDFALMYFVRPVMRAVGLPLSLLGIVLAVFQVALSIQFGLFAIHTILRQGL
jgi:multiple antibiotic resistance protein